MVKSDIIQAIRAGQRAKRKAQPPKLQGYLHAGLVFFLSSAAGVGAVTNAQYLGASGRLLMTISGLCALVTMLLVANALRP